MSKQRIIIDGVTTNYFIYSDGRVYSEHSKRFLKKGESYSKNYYKTVILSIEGKEYTKFRHRLVAQYFVDNPQNKNEVNHIDGNKHNNLHINLEWCTRQENLQHQKNNYLYRRRTVHQYTLEGELIKVFRTCSEVEHVLGYDSKAISACCVGEIQNAYGFIWSDSPRERNSFIGKNNKLRKQEIVMTDLYGVPIRNFSSASEVYRFFGKRDNGTVSQVCKGKKNTWLGYRFHYKNFKDYQNTDFKPLYKTIAMLSMSGEYIRSFNSLQLVYKHFNKRDSGAVSQVCNNIRASIWQHKFEYRH